MKRNVYPILPMTLGCDRSPSRAVARRLIQLAKDFSKTLRHPFSNDIGIQQA
jgi:hypothetical protein